MSVRMYLKLYCQERDLGDEYGWEQIHGDVFRPATHRLLFTALIGTGYHVSVVSLCTIIFAIVGELYTEWVVLRDLCALYTREQILLPWCLMTTSNSFDKTDREYSSLASTDDLIDSGGQRSRSQQTEVAKTCSLMLGHQSPSTTS